MATDNVDNSPKVTIYPPKPQDTLNKPEDSIELTAADEDIDLEKAKDVIPQKPEQDTDLQKAKDITDAQPTQDKTEDKPNKTDKTEDTTDDDVDLAQDNVDLKKPEDDTDTKNPEQNTDHKPTEQNPFLSQTETEDNQAQNNIVMDDNEIAALLVSLKDKVPVNNNKDDQKTQTEASITNATSSKVSDSDSNSNSRKRTHSEMESDSKSNPIPLSMNTTNSSPEPFSDIDWNNTKFVFIRLTYFNKRKCRRFPLNINDYSVFTHFVEHYFQSLTHCKWHCECDENWIECLQDLNAIIEEHISSSNSCNFFLELMIINESLPIQHIYAPKAIYIDNPYKCKYLAAATPKVEAIAPNAPYPPSFPQQIPPTAYYPPPTYAPITHAHPPPTAAITSIPPPQRHIELPPSATRIQTQNTVENTAGYHHVTYPHYLQRSGSSSSLRGETNRNGHKRSGLISGGAICPDPTTYLPFAHAGQSTPQMRTLHKIVWVLQHQTKALTIDAIRQCLPGKKKAQINEIDYLLSSYQSYGYTKCTMLNSRKVWSLCKDAFPPEFWNMQWQRTN